MTSRSLAAALVLLLAGCAADTHRSYPSLVPRASERQDFSEPAPSAPAAVAADPALDARIAEASRALADTAKAFDKVARRAESAARAARGASAGSERWIEAQTMLAELDSLRAQSRETQTALEDIAIERATALAPDYPALETARAATQAQIDAQTARIDAMQAQLART